MASRRNFLKRASATAGVGIFTATDSFSLSGSTKNLRDQFLIHPDTAYLNTGTLGSSPLSVIETVEKTVRLLEADPAGENWGGIGRRMDDTRIKIAGLINSPVEDIVLTRNTTEGLSLVTSSMDLKSGDEIITTTMEHGGAEVGLEYLCKRTGAVLRKIELPLLPSSAEEVAHSVTSQLGNKTKVLLLSHVNTITGMVMPFHLISDHCKSRGIFLVADGAQSVGQIEVDVRKMGVDAFAASGHKWLLGPKETGFLYLRRDSHNGVLPVFLSDGFGSYTRASGTRNAATIIGLGAAIDWNKEAGPHVWQTAGLKLRPMLSSELKKIRNCVQISPSADALTSNILSFRIEGLNNNDIAGALRDKNVLVKVLPQINAIRISFAPYNSEKDLIALIDGLKKISG